MKSILIILFSLGMISVCSAQSDVEQTRSERTRHFEVFYPNYQYYFELDNRFRPSIPLLNIGLEFKQFNSHKNGFQLSLATDYLRGLKAANKFGEIAQRLALIPSAGYNRTWKLKNDKSYFSLEGNAISRVGGFSIFASSNEFETVFGFYDFLDFGLSFGGQLLYCSRKNFVFSISLEHAYFPLVKDKGIEFYDIPSSPKHQTIFTLGLGMIR